VGTRQHGIRNSKNHTENPGRVVLAIKAWMTGKAAPEAVNQQTLFIPTRNEGPEQKSQLTHKIAKIRNNPNEVVEPADQHTIFASIRKLTRNMRPMEGRDTSKSRQA
jgi:hypothetical protein